MAGGTFDKNVEKVRAGTYINFKAQDVAETVRNGTRGTVVMPIIKSCYGPAGGWLKVTAASPDACKEYFGYSVYDSDPNRQMLLIREALKNATTVYAYILAEGTKATGTGTLGETSEDEETTGTSLTATAMYGGTRGNALSVSITANAVEGYDVTIYLDGNKMEKWEGLSTIQDLIDQGSAYITFTGSGDLDEIAALVLSGGTDGEATNSDVTEWMDAWSSVKFNTACLPVDDSALKAAAVTKIKYMRDKGKGVQVVLPDYEADYEGVINVVNSVQIDDDSLTHAEACAWVAGATAGASYVESNTFKPYDGATGIVDPIDDEAADAAITAGKFFFSISEENAVVVDMDINSLVTLGNGKDKSYRKNRVIRVFDTLQEDIQSTFPPGKFDNKATDWEVMQGLGRSLLTQYEDAGAIKNVDTENDFVVDTENSSGDQTYFDVYITPVDSSEKLYFSVTTSI